MNFNNEENIKGFIEGIQGEEIAFSRRNKERKTVPLKKENVRKRKDGYYNIHIDSAGRERIAIVPRDTIERMIKEGVSPRTVKDRCNTLSALGKDWDKPLMYYAIVAYDLVPKEEWKKWLNSTPLLDYELIHFNGNIDDIRKENVKLALRDKKVWNKVKKEFKSKKEKGAVEKYLQIREEHNKKITPEYPNLKMMSRVMDPLKSLKITNENNLKYSKELQETISK